MLKLLKMNRVDQIVEANAENAGLQEGGLSGEHQAVSSVAPSVPEPLPDLGGMPLGDLQQPPRKRQRQDDASGQLQPGLPPEGLTGAMLTAQQPASEPQALQTVELALPTLTPELPVLPHQHEQHVLDSSLLPPAPALEGMAAALAHPGTEGAPVASHEVLAVPEEGSHDGQDGSQAVHNRQCAVDGCGQRAYYNDPRNSQPLVCKSHKTREMIRVYQKRCAAAECFARPSFNQKGTHIPLFCGKHKEPAMVNVRRENCQHEGCFIQPSFNFEGQSERLYCSKHKVEGMVDVRNKSFCGEPGCATRPHYNFPGNWRPLFCSRHKQPGMVDIHNKRCETEGCENRASFNYEDQPRGLFCSQHKLEGMVNVIKLPKRRQAASSQAAEPVSGSELGGGAVEAAAAAALVTAPVVPVSYSALVEAATQAQAAQDQAA